MGTFDPAGIKRSRPRPLGLVYWRLEIQATARGGWAAGEPDSAEVGMAVGSARRGSAEIGLAVFGARRTRQRQIDPLGLRGDGQAQGEEKARAEVREFDAGSLGCGRG